MRITARHLVPLALLAISACARKEAAPAPKANAEPVPAGPVALQGAGAVVPHAFFSKLFEEYVKANDRVHIDYQSVGPGAAIQELGARTIDFGTVALPLTDEEIATAPAKLVHIPVAVGAVVLAYNVPGVPSGLKLTPDVVAGIYLGNIKKWNAPRIAVLNRGRKLPARAITAVYRSDASGATGVFTSYLSTVSPTWKERVGASKNAKFPAGLAAEGSAGMLAQVKDTPGAIGYVVLAQAQPSGLPYATLMNRAGKYVEPTMESIGAAAAGAAASMSEDFRASIIDAPGDGAYPIASFSYVLAYQDMADAAKAKALAQFLWWAVHDGQRLGPTLAYAQLPRDVVAKVGARLNTLTARGKPLL
jgi:phosphate transport system substrate-binding protein